MTKIILLILGIWMMLVAAHNNTTKALEFITENGKSFITWTVVIIVISAIYAQQTLKPLAGAMLVLMIVAMLVSNSNYSQNIRSELSKLQNYASGKGSLCGGGSIQVTVGSTTSTTNVK